MPHYINIITKSYLYSDGPSTASVRVRPLPGQGFSTDMNVECSRTVRDKYPVGTLFKLRVKPTSADGGREFLYSSYQWPMSVVNEQEARTFIENNF